MIKTSESLFFVCPKLVDPPQGIHNTATDKEKQIVEFYCSEI